MKVVNVDKNNISLKACFLYNIKNKIILGISPDTVPGPAVVDLNIVGHYSHLQHHLVPGVLHLHLPPPVDVLEAGHAALAQPQVGGVADVWQHQRPEQERGRS